MSDTKLSQKVLKDSNLVKLAVWDKRGEHRLEVVHVTGSHILDVEASTGVLMWSQVSEFLMLNPVQFSPRAHLSEQSFNEDDDIVSFALSNAHIAGPFFVFLNPLYDVTLTEFRRDVTGIISFIIISSSGRNIDTIITFIFVFWYPMYHNIRLKR